MANPPGITNENPIAEDPDINLYNIFQSFGYTPTQAELDSLAGAFGGANNAQTKAAGVSAVAQYVNYQNQIKQFEANDPLNALQTRMNNIIDQNTKSVQNLSSQLQSTLSAAPQLFGSLTPDQIQTYLKPLQDTFNQQLSQVQGAIASRGLAASSTENNALAQTNQEFQNQVFSTGLSVGLQSQQNQANALQEQINNLFGQTGQAIGVTGQAAGQKSAQDLSQSNLLASLPSFLNAQALQTGQFNTNATRGNSFLDTFNQVTSGINTGIDTIGNLMTLGKNINTPFGGVSNAGPVASVPSSSGSLSVTGSGTPGTAAYYGFNPQNNALFANTGSMFGS